MQDILKIPAVERLFEVLGELFIVGGAVRNSVLGLPAADIDFATPLEPAGIEARLGRARIAHDVENAKFGIVAASLSGARFEIATFRRDIYGKSRYPGVEFVKTAGEDAPRRDFTMNALYMDGAGHILDFLGGLGDIGGKVVRFVGDPGRSVREDPLRIPRYFRFCSEYFHENFDAPSWDACVAAVSSLASLSRKKAACEFGKLLRSPGRDIILALWEKNGILEEMEKYYG